MPTTTANYSFYKPVQGGDNTTWGGYLNDNADFLDTMFSDCFEGGTPQVALGTIKKTRLPAVYNPIAIESSAATGLSVTRTGNADNSAVKYSCGTGNDVYAGRGGDGVFSVSSTSNLVASSATLKVDVVNKTVTVLGKIVLTDNDERDRILSNLALAADASVGTYRILALDAVNTAITTGSVYAGSSLTRVTLATGTSSNVQVSGTPGGSWQAMGGANAVSGQRSGCLFLRVA